MSNKPNAVAQKQSSSGSSSAVLPSKVQRSAAAPESRDGIDTGYFVVDAKDKDVKLPVSPSPSEAVDLRVLSKYLPQDPVLQQACLSKVIQYYADAGRLDCISNFGSDQKELIGDNWKKPSGISKMKHDQYFEIFYANVDTRMTTTDLGSIFGTTQQSSHRCTRLMPTVASYPLSSRWTRQTDTIKMKEVSINLMITPTINLTGSTPPLMDAEQQIVEVMVIVDTMSLLSNSSGFNQAVGLVDTSYDVYTSSNSPNTVFSQPYGAGNTPPFQAYANSTMLPNQITKDSRFRILYHRKYPIRYYSNWLETTDNKCVQTPGENQFHQIHVNMGDYLAPFTDSTSLEPYINNTYFLIWGNTSTTTANGYYSLCHYGLRCHFQDVGDQ